MFPSNPREAITPDWYQRIRNPFNAGIASLFLLHFNVRDRVFCPEWELAQPSLLPRVREYLCELWRKQGVADLILVYSLTEGIIRYLGPSDGLAADQTFSTSLNPEQLYDRLVKAAVTRPHDLWEEFRAPANDKAHIREPRYAFAFLDRLLTQQFKKESPQTQSTDEPAEQSNLRIMLIIDSVEHLAPASQHSTPDILQMSETLTRWAINETIRMNRHMIVLLADDINQVNPALSATGTGVHQIELLRPDRSQRRAFLEWLRDTQQLNGDDNELARLASVSAGFNFADLQDMAAYARKHHREPPNEGKITLAQVREHKRRVIRAESRELLEFMEPDPDNPTSWKHIGGLNHVVESLKTVAAWLGDEDVATQKAPKGMLFVGPPGTGKSLVAQALAFESGINMVKLRNIQNSYVGESERNMSRVLDIVRAFAPVIVFIDEIDQAYGQRSTGQLDSGVTARLFGQLLEFMGDNQHRGRVLWIAASNRPDYIDDALISRFDRIIPFVLPNEASRALILSEAMPRIARFKWSETAGPVWDKLVSETKGYSGRLIEQVVRRALEAVEVPNSVNDQICLTPLDVRAALEVFKPNYNKKMYELQTLLAYQVTNFTDFLPQPDDAELEHSFFIDGKFDSDDLSSKIKAVRKELGISY